jgi:hypothetical protein
MVKNIKCKKIAKYFQYFCNKRAQESARGRAQVRSKRFAQVKSKIMVAARQPLRRWIRAALRRWLRAILVGAIHRAPAVRQPCVDGYASALLCVSLHPLC